MVKYFLGILGLSSLMFPITFVLGMVLASLWFFGGGYALIVGIVAIPKYSAAKLAKNQLAIVRLQSEIQLLAASPVFLLAGGYMLVKLLATVM